MIKYYLLLFISLSSVLLSCGNGSNESKIKRTAKDAERKAAVTKADSTLYVSLSSHSSKSVEAILKETSGKITLSIDEMQPPKIYGSLNDNDELALMADMNSKTLLSSINISELKNLWLLDDDSGNGIRIDDGGTLSNVGEFANVTLKRWQIYDGGLQFSFISSDGANFEESTTGVGVIELTNKILHINFLGKSYRFHSNEE